MCQVNLISIILAEIRNASCREEHVGVPIRRKWVPIVGHDGLLWTAFKSIASMVMMGRGKPMYYLYSCSHMQTCTGER